jgi:hypothetical protein
MIGKWLNAGVLEDGKLSYPEAGSPQSGVISPVLANVYLHYVLDEWFARVVKPPMKGRVLLIRSADDFAIGFTCEEDPRRVMAVLPKRFGKYGLTIHPEKTRLVPFRRPPQRPAHRGGKREGHNGTFDLLGFTHYWALTRKERWMVKQKTASNRFTRALRAIAHWCRQNRHRPISEQHHILSQKLQGHIAYYGITGNSYAVSRFRSEVQRVWRKWLGRRNSKGRHVWSRFERIKERYQLPAAVVVHSV